MTVTIDVKSPLKVTVGSPVTVKYTASDAAGNTRECTVKVEAKGTAYFDYMSVHTSISEYFHMRRASLT